MADTKIKTVTVKLEVFDIACYDLGGSLDRLIAQLVAIREDAKTRGLTNVNVETDYTEEAIYEYGGYQGNFERKWTVTITGEKAT